MTTVEQVAPVDPAAAAAPMPIASRLFGAIAVGVALLSATATFLVLAGMTPIDPVQSVVADAACGQCRDQRPLARHHRAGSLGRDPGPPPRPRRIAPARADRQPVRRHRRGPDRPCRGGRFHDARSRPRPLLLLEHARHHRGFGFRRQRLCARTSPGHARRSLGAWPTSSPAPSRCSTRTATSSTNS